MDTVLHSVCSPVALLMVAVGVWSAITSAGVLGLWMGMEVSFLGLIYLMSEGSENESESAMKYFIVQVVGSCFLLIGLLLMSYFKFPTLVEILVMLGVAVKMGVFPFHFWVPGVMSSCSWFCCFMISVIQKAAPLWMISNFCFEGMMVNVMDLLAVLTTLSGCLGGLGMLNYRALLGYSSMVHSGFLIILSLVNLNFFWVYLTAYGVLNFGVMMTLWKLNLYSYHDLLNDVDWEAWEEFTWVCMYFFSLAGIPPFSGVVLKVYFLVNCWDFSPVSCVLCLLASAVSMYYYITVTVEMMVVWSEGLCRELVEKEYANPRGLSVMSFIVNILFSYPLYIMCGA